ncbi:MAG: hypothetical protein AYL28_001120 [Candidatus Bathyarchaeota archaeon B23]|nr:MAG: hypothetical protein AYL28_001120 [Candidatus Bathyarchaeota archaeon B23]
MGRRRRKVVKVVRKKLPVFFLCPRCGKNAVRVTINKKVGSVTVICGFCNLSASFDMASTMAPVDAYCLFVDNYYGMEGHGEVAVRER